MKHIFLNILLKSFIVLFRVTKASDHFKKNQKQEEYNQKVILESRIVLIC